VAGSNSSAPAVALKLGQKSPRPQKILIVEDNALVAETFAAVLGSAGHDIVIAQDGEEAWELFGRHGAKFDAVLADYNMPRISGGELLRRVKASGFPGRVLIVSGYLTAEKVEDLIRLGADGVLRKPFSPTELFGMLETGR
jgi:CheY-like chemotaxis protein